MAHPVSNIMIEEDIFILNQLAAASPSYLKELRATHAYEKEDEVICTDFDYEYMRYQDYVFNLVSDYLIKCATRTRILQDYLRECWESEYNPDEDAYNNFEDVAVCIQGDIKLSIREICNKIIHATRFELDYIDPEQRGYKHWSGRCHLHGNLRGKPWHVELNLKRWGFALQRYFDNLK